MNDESMNSGGIKNYHGDFHTALGVSNKNNENTFEYSLANFNDIGRSFEEIADILEKDPEAYCVFQEEDG